MEKLGIIIVKLILFTMYAVGNAVSTSLYLAMPKEF